MNYGVDRRRNTKQLGKMRMLSNNEKEISPVYTE